MRIGELAFKIHVHRVHAWRLASAGVVPGTKRTKGGHFYFVKSRSLTRWINFMKSNGAHRRKEMTRAYQRGYGGKTPSQKQEENKDWYNYKLRRKQAAENRKEFKNYRNDYDDLFLIFFDDIDTLIRVLEETITWPESKTKSAMLKDSSERLMILRDLIDKWLNLPAPI